MKCIRGQVKAFSFCFCKACDTKSTIDSGLTDPAMYELPTRQPWGCVTNFNAAI